MIKYIKDFLKWESNYKYTKIKKKYIPRVSTVFLIAGLIWNWVSIILIYLRVTRAGWIVANFVLTLLSALYIYYDLGGALDGEPEISEDTLTNLPEKDPEGKSSLLLGKRESEGTPNSTDTDTSIFHNSESEELDDDGLGAFVNSDWGSSSSGLNIEELELGDEPGKDDDGGI